MEFPEEIFPEDKGNPETDGMEANSDIFIDRRTAAVPLIAR